MKEFRSDLVRLLAPLIVCGGVVWAPVNIVENIRPWEPLWCLWVSTTFVCGACFGAVAMDVWRSRHR